MLRTTLEKKQAHCKELAARIEEVLAENKERVLGLEGRIKEAKLENLQLANDTKAVKSKS